MSDPPSSERAALEGRWLEANATAFAVATADPGTLLISTRRAVTRWSALSPGERGDVMALVDALGGDAGEVEFPLVAPDDRWYLRLRRGADPFAGLPAFVGGEEQHLLPALLTALARADEAELLAAFVQRSGLRLLRLDLEDALLRGARVRVLTGDYLGYTAPDALRELLELSGEHPRLQVAVYQCAGDTSFHPKAYIFSAGARTVAYVGSSNLSRSALTGGVEWNLRAAHAQESAALRARFTHLWTARETAPLTAAWIDAYAARVPPTSVWDPPERPPAPHAIQRDALAALARARADGARRGLVVLATGLGKTLLAAFAALQLGATRVLFVAHREEIVTQARRAFEWVLPDRSTGLFMGPRRAIAADLVFASVQTLARPEHLASWARDHFDLVVIDEFHHAAALGYRRILAHFEPTFMLGITATPERGDGAPLLELCADNLVFRADLAQGIACGRLVPFVYHGLRDTIDYQAIPWRSGRFDPAALGRAVATVAHAEQALAGYREHAPRGRRRGLWFCASIAHAEFMAAFLRERGIPAVAVHSDGGAPRAASLRALMAGSLEAITTVDVFNEGVDVPDINVVVLLRPTESRVVFLQQIGRGLRLPERSHKPHLVILDFIGNHRSFLGKPEALLTLLGLTLGGRAATRRLREGDLPLPPGCSVHIETEVIDLLTRLARDGGGDTIRETLARLCDDLGRRPTLRELAADGLQVGAVARDFGSWWDLLQREELLGADEARVLAAWRAELVALEVTRERSPASWSALRRWLELGGVAQADVDGGDPLLALWPAALVRRDGAITLRRAIDDADAAVLEAMIDEIAAAREVATRRARGVAALPTGVPLKVLRNASKQPILMFTRTPETPRGEVEVWIEGEPYTLRFVKIAVNVARARPGGPNLLGALLKGLFGPHAGDNGTDHRAVLRVVDGRWTLIPALDPTLAAAPALPYFRELAVACGLGDERHGEAAARPIRIRSEHAVDPRRHFVVRARGGSMDGGPRPIRDGDLVLCARLDAPPPELVEGKPCLLVAHRGPDASEALIKVPTRAADGAWILRSWSKGQVDLSLDRWEALRVVARIVGVVQAEPGEHV